MEIPPDLAELITKAKGYGFEFVSQGDFEQEALVLDEFVCEMMALDTELSDMELSEEIMRPLEASELAEVRKRIWTKISEGDWAGLDVELREQIADVCPGIMAD